MQNKKWSRGYTVVEVFVVVAIIAIMTAISFPSFSSILNGAKFKDEARGIASVLRFARSESARHNLEYRVYFDVENSRYKLEMGDSCHDSSNWEDASGGWRTFQAGVTMAAPSTCNNFTQHRIIHFNPNGSANKLYICVMDGTEKQFTVGVSHTTTGRVRIDN